ncbi:MAG: flagellar biosynthetic protein FliO [Eubacteriales bacterium]
MILMVTSGWNDWFQFLVVMGVFILVLWITYVATKFIASAHQSRGGRGNNIEVIETCGLTTNKYLQVIRIGNQHMVIAVCKDNITFLTELADENIESFQEIPNEMIDFKDILEKAKNFKLKK